MTAEQKRLERLHILATLAAHGPMTGLEIVKHANEECCDARFEGVPDLTNRGIGQKLSGLERTGHVRGRVKRSRVLRERVCEWDITVRGRELLAENGVEV
jgi:hypothetical protein